MQRRPYETGVSKEARREAFRTGQEPVAVYGLGKMGLPLAAVFADVSGAVVGADIDRTVVDTINRGESHIDGEPGLAELVEQTVDDGSLSAVSDPATAAAEASIHVIIIPTPITTANEPDLSILEHVVADVATGLDPGDLVLVECTVPPGTCSTLVEPTLAAESGLEPSEFGVAFCPERTSSGRAIRDITESYPKIVGGTDQTAAAAAASIYEEVTDAGVIRLPDAATAEAVKLFEGVYRDVNIALANELARLTDHLAVDVREAIEAANTQPYCDIHDPGPGVGGHCIPYYPYFIMDRVEAETPLLRTARAVNDSMPAFTVEVLERELGAREAAGGSLAGTIVLVLGLTYRPGVEETRATPAKGIVDGLRRRGVDVLTVDPVLDDHGAFDGTQVALTDVETVDADAAVMVTPHAEFDDIEWTAFDPLVVVDGRDTLDLSETAHHVYTLGRGSSTGRDGE